MMQPTKTNIAIVGSRNWTDFQMIYDLIASLNPKTTRIYTGGAPGADTFAETSARRCGIEVVVIPALWDKYGKRAGMIRNGEIIPLVTKMYAFWDGESAGTKNMIDRAMKAQHITGCYVEKKAVSE